MTDHGPDGGAHTARGLEDTESQAKPTRGKRINWRIVELGVTVGVGAVLFLVVEALWGGISLAAWFLLGIAWVMCSGFARGTEAQAKLTRGKRIVWGTVELGVTAGITVVLFLVVEALWGGISLAAWFLLGMVWTIWGPSFPPDSD